MATSSLDLAKFRQQLEGMRNDLQAETRLAFRRRLPTPIKMKALA